MEKIVDKINMNHFSYEIVLPILVTLPSELHVKTCQRHVLTRNARNAEYWHMPLQVVT